MCGAGGGAPWQTAQDVDESVKSFVPFWCVAPAELEVKPGWHVPQSPKLAVPPDPAGATTCVAAGGRPWQELHSPQLPVSHTLPSRCVVGFTVVAV